MLEPAKPARGRCLAAICFSWKVITCVVSHVLLVLLVVSYCVGGAYLFQHLERPHEIEVSVVTTCGLLQEIHMVFFSGQTGYTEYTLQSHRAYLAAVGRCARAARERLDGEREQAPGQLREADTHCDQDGWLGWR